MSIDLTTDLAELLDLALGVAREAGAQVVAMREQGVDVAGTKTSDIDIVTLADQASEELIRTRLLAARPEDGFIGEEGSDLPGTSGVRWIVDPIDGTVNYLYGLPNYSVSIAAAIDGESVVGVVLAPASGEEYVAARGRGATRNGEPLRVRAKAELGQSLISTGFNYEADIRAVQAAAVGRMLPQVRDIRRFGSCALDLCAVAAGNSDGYVEEGVNLWDHAAGGLVATEAGATVEVAIGASGRTLIIAAPTAGFGPFRTLVTACGFEAEGD